METTKTVHPLALAKNIHQEMIDLRRDLHQHPEIGFELHRTAQLISQKLKEYGLPVKTGINKTGVVADLIIPNAKKRIALRADMDALPIQELGNPSYKSLIPNQAHLCGHDAHMSMLLGAAKMLTSLKNQLQVNVRFIFQPSEECWPGGAPGMIEEGVLDDVDEIYALHVWPTLETGHYGICVGPAMAQADGFDILINGQGGHAAAPHAAIDPLLIGTQIVQSLQTIISQNRNPIEQAVLTVTQFHAGTCYNAIPDSCIINGTVRTYSIQTKEMIKKRIQEIANSIAHSFGARAQVNYHEGYPVTYNDETTAHKVHKNAAFLVGDDAVNFPAQKVLFGEDFAYYLQKVKGCFIHLGCKNKLHNSSKMLHDPNFDIDEECLIYGAGLFTQLTLNSKQE
jgi:amidohydrolase